MLRVSDSRALVSKRDTNITYCLLYGRGSETIPREGRENVRGGGLGGVMGNTAFWASNDQFLI